MKKILSVLLLLLLPAIALAQSNPNTAKVVSSPPTYTNGQVAPLTEDTSGNLRVSGSVTTTPSGTQDENLKQVNGTTTSTGNGTTDAGTQRVSISSDSTGGITILPSSSSSAAITPVVSSSAESNHVLKGSAGNLYGVCTTNGATAGYVMVFNATSAPVDGAVTPIAWLAMPGTNTTTCLSYGQTPDRYSTGITVVYSSTGPFTKTASATAAFAGRVQ